jgi:hypothetical protein
MDWTYLRVAEKFWFVLVRLDWYSRKIIAWVYFQKLRALKLSL